ncbi:alpha/beta hydrolase [Bdellovibrio bacteriovorus]|uniref:alpha/beta hydrolase n=1 Tax=Bdellovibrio bacteriovorus TaxID=959 RepID=UPI0035A5AF7D
MANFTSVCRTFLKCVALLLLMGCQSFFYYPKKEKLFDPTSLRMQPEDVYLKTRSGEYVHGWFFASQQSDSKGTLLFFHGNAENLTSHFLMFQWLPAQGYNFFVFDYPGYGASSGKPDPKGSVEAGVAAAEYLYEFKDSRPLILYGHSLGGIVAMRTAEEVQGRIPLRNIVIEASFASYKEMGRQVMKRRWWTWPLQPLSYLVISDQYAPKSLKSISPTPLLFIHGSGDRAVEVESSERMYAEASFPKELWVIPEGGHGDLYEMNHGELREQFLSYLSKTSTASQ